MALTEYTYRRDGVTLAYLQGLVPGAGGSVSDQEPPIYQAITWDSTYKTDLDAAMAAAGWSYLWSGAAPSALTIAQIQTTVLGSDGSSIAPGDGWVTVCTTTIDTRGNSTVSALVSAVSDSNGSGTPHMRLLVNCPGIFTDVLVGAAQYDLITTDQGGRVFSAPRPIADTSPTAKTYTFTLQFSVTGASSTIRALIGTLLTLVEYRA